MLINESYNGELLSSCYATKPSSVDNTVVVTSILFSKSKLGELRHGTAKLYRNARLPEEFSYDSNDRHGTATEKSQWKARVTYKSFSSLRLPFLGAAVGFVFCVVFGPFFNCFKRRSFDVNPH